LKIIDPENLKIYVKVPEKQKDDKIFGIIVDHVSSRIQSALNRILTSAEYTEKYNAGKKFYFLKAFPIDMGTPPVVTVAGTTKTKDVDYFVWEQEGMIEFDVAPTRSKPQEVQVVYTGGYSATDGILNVPDDLKRACMIQSAHDYKRRDELGLSAVRMGDGSVNVQTKTELLPEVVSILKSYRARPADR
jgi:hypothetical protein